MPFVSRLAKAAMGVRQEPSSTARQARSAATSWLLRRSLSAASQVRVCSSLLRASRPIAPWATAGSISSGSNT